MCELHLMIILHLPTHAALYKWQSELTMKGEVQDFLTLPMHACGYPSM